MNPNNDSIDPDLAKVESALQDAAREARKIAFFTRTPLIFYKDGKIIRKYVSAHEMHEYFHPTSSS